MRKKEEGGGLKDKILLFQQFSRLCTILPSGSTMPRMTKSAR